MTPSRFGDIATLQPTSTELAPAKPDQLSPKKGKPPPIPEICYRHGFDVSREAYRGCSEAADAFGWASFVVPAAMTIGRARFTAGGARDFPNIFVVQVAGSGDRKSTAQRRALELLAEVDEGVAVCEGISSPEGLVAMLASEDGSPRRLLLSLNELSQLLKKGHSDATAGLPSMLCSLYDCPESKSIPRVRDPLIAKEPFMCVYSSTTKDWLHDSLTASDIRGGLANRFWYFVGESKPPIPFPPAPDHVALDQVRGILIAARERTTTDQAVTFSPEALEYFSPWYCATRTHEYNSSTLETLGGRIDCTARKLSLIYSALEGTSEVTLPQIEAACAFADWQRQVHEHVLGDYGGGRTKKIEDKLRTAIEAAHREGSKPRKRELQQTVRRVDGLVASWEFNQAYSALINSHEFAEDPEGFVVPGV